MKETYRHIVEAEKYSTQAHVLFNIQRAKELFNVIADDVGVKLIEKEIL
jgi:hypothetical protein